MRARRVGGLFAEGLDWCIRWGHFGEKLCSAVGASLSTECEPGCRGKCGVLLMEPTSKQVRDIRRYTCQYSSRGSVELVCRAIGHMTAITIL